MTLTRSILFFTVSVILTVGCASQHQPMSANEYQLWMNDENSGLIKKKYVNGVEIIVKYLSPEYLAFREISNDQTLTVEDKDSIISQYSNSLNFVLTLGPDDRKSEGQDIMYRDVSDYIEYKSRVKALNFDIEQSVKIRTDSVEFLPVLSAMENIYSLDTKRNIILAFVPDVGNEDSFFNSDKLGFVYDDQLFNLGVNHFVFKRSDMMQIPTITY